MQLDSGKIRGAVELLLLLLLFSAKWVNILTCIQCYIFANLRHLPLVTPKPL